ncbi:MAG: hypothetical protein CVT88_08420 [Candidatus Altiarchaeales archaeon HGW-Altiarchaeales-1]|nr:MAG: hypothetical protein CVT88_08420 [Candidatus Altiarchaeales archaeon HGW-Altiarchaeales-1]
MEKMKSNKKLSIGTGIGILALAIIAIVAVVLISGCVEEKPSTTKDDDVIEIKQVIYDELLGENKYRLDIKIENIVFVEGGNAANANVSITNPKYPKTGEGYEIILIKTNDTWVIQSKNQTWIA